MSFTSNPGTYFWSNGYAWGTCEVKEKEAVLSVLSGEVELDSFSLDGMGTKKLKGKTIEEGESLQLNL